MAIKKAKKKTAKVGKSAKKRAAVRPKKSLK